MAVPDSLDQHPGGSDRSEKTDPYAAARMLVNAYVPKAAPIESANETIKKI
jgi:hypothetical protein